MLAAAVDHDAPPPAPPDRPPPNPVHCVLPEDDEYVDERSRVERLRFGSSGFGVRSADHSSACGPRPNASTHGYHIGFQPQLQRRAAGALLFHVALERSFAHHARDEGDHFRRADAGIPRRADDLGGLLHDVVIHSRIVDPFRRDGHEAAVARLADEECADQQGSDAEHDRDGDLDRLYG